MRPHGHDRTLYVGTGLMLLLAGGLLLGGHLPLSGGRGELGAGEVVPADLAVRTVAGGDTLKLAGGSPVLLLVYRSACPACAENLPGWLRLLEEIPPSVRILGVPLEADGPGLAYLRAQLPDAVAVRPLAPRRFLQVLGIRRVPSTLLIDARGALRFRASGILEPEAIEDLLEAD